MPLAEAGQMAQTVIEVQSQSTGQVILTSLLGVVSAVVAALVVRMVTKKRGR